jgi:hypothetical protein
VYTFAAAVGDASGNVYVGIGSGNSFSILATTANSNDTFLGTGAGGSTSNVKNGVFIGYRAGFGSILASNSISIGANTLNGGNSNIYIGCATGISSGSNNIFLGPGLSNGGTSVSNRLLIGSGANTAIIGDLVNNRIGINLTTLPTTLSPDIKLDVNGYARIGTNRTGGLGINTMPGYYALDVNGNLRVSDGYGIFTLSNSGTNCVASISNTSGYEASSTATLQVTGGYISSNGTTGVSTTTTVPFKKGMFMLSATSNTTRHGYIGVASSSSEYSLVSSNSSSLITANGSTLVVAAGTVGWNITYFPTP